MIIDFLYNGRYHVYQRECRMETLADIAFYRIKEDILCHVLPPDTRLTIEQLKLRYDIGPTPIREALNRLVVTGFANANGLKGFRVTNLSLNELQDLHQTRQLIDTEALARALQKGDDEWEANLLGDMHRLSKIDTSRHKRNTIAEWLQRLSRFYLTLFGACDSPWLIALHRQLNEQSRRYDFLQLENDPELEQSLHHLTRQHKTLGDCAINKMADKAEQQLHLILRQREKALKIALQ